MSLRNFKELYNSKNDVLHMLEESFTDGSKGYSVSIVQGDQKVIIDCINRKSANKLFDKLADIFEDKDDYVI